MTYFIVPSLTTVTGVLLQPTITQQSSVTVETCLASVHHTHTHFHAEHAVDHSQEISLSTVESLLCLVTLAQYTLIVIKRIYIVLAETETHPTETEIRSTSTGNVCTEWK